MNNDIEKTDRDFKVLEDYCKTRFTSIVDWENIEFAEVVLPIPPIKKEDKQ